MKAINLIPADQRRGAGGAAGRTGGAAYAIVGVLALVLLMYAALTVTNRQIKEKTAEASSLQDQATIRSQQAAALGPYAKFAELRANRVQTVKKLVDSRFDWAHAMGEVARTLPADTWLTALTGTVAPGVGSDVGGASNPLRASRAVPALEMTGCSTSQTAVTTFIARLKLMNGVDRVSLSSSKKTSTDTEPSTDGPGDSALGSSGNVRKNPCTPTRPSFNLVVFYEGLINPPGKTGAPTVNTSTTPSAPGTPPATTATTTPAAGGTTTTPTTQSAPATAGGTQ